MIISVKRPGFIVGLMFLLPFILHGQSVNATRSAQVTPQTINPANSDITAEITLSECIDLAVKNYPLVKNYELISKSNSYTIANLNTGYLPAFTINGQYTCQSDVTSLPIELPNINIPEMDKEQYKVYAEVSQVIYDGGVIKNRREAAKAQSDIELSSLETELYKVKERVSEIYFGILLIDRQRELTASLLQDINAGFLKVEAAFKGGIVLVSNVDALKAEIIKAEQRMNDLSAARNMYLTMLSAFIQKPLPENTSLAMPDDITTGEEIFRPELDLFEARLKALDVQSSFTTSKILPKLNAFVQGGYGSPALNMLDPDAQLFYFAGIRLAWPLTSLYTNGREKAIIGFSRQQIDQQRKAFLFNTNQQLIKENIEIERIRKLLESDQELVRLRENISKASMSQLENGTITSADYIRDISAADQARISLQLHTIQLLLAKYKHQLITGIKEQ